MSEEFFVGGDDDEKWQKEVKLCICSAQFKAKVMLRFCGNTHQ